MLRYKRHCNKNVINEGQYITNVSSNHKNHVHMRNLLYLRPDINGVLRKICNVTHYIMEKYRALN